MENLTEDEIFRSEFRAFRQSYQTWADIYDWVYLALMIVGIPGCCLGLFTLFKCRSFRNPSFSYNKALMSSDLLFCLNWCLLKFVNSLQDSQHKLHFPNPLLAFVSGILTRVITSTCGYIALYMTFYITIDRFLALYSTTAYFRFNRALVAHRLIFCGCFSSLLLHSWSPWFEKRVVPVYHPTLNQTCFTFTLAHSVPKYLLKAKDIYNAILRVVYPFVLSVLTLATIYRFVQQRNKRSSMTSCLTHTLEMHRRRKRRERSLFLLMMAVVLLIYVQVIPRESKRVLEFMYPLSDLAAKVRERSLPFSERLRLFKIGLYGHQMSVLLVNVCVAVNRSLLFYLYFCLNSNFRESVIRCINGIVASVLPRLSWAIGICHDNHEQPTSHGTATHAPRDRPSTFAQFCKGQGDKLDSLVFRERRGSDQRPLVADECSPLLADANEAGASKKTANGTLNLTNGVNISDGAAQEQESEF